MRGRLFRAVLGDVVLARLLGVLGRHLVVAPRGVRVVRGFLVVAGFVVLGRFLVVGGGVGMMLGGFVVVFGGLFAHRVFCWGLLSSDGKAYGGVCDAGRGGSVSVSPVPRRLASDVLVTNKRGQRGLGRHHTTCNACAGVKSGGSDGVSSCHA